MLVKRSTRKNKRYMAHFKNGLIIHFGLLNGSTYIDHHDKNKRNNYIKRHEIREDFKDAYSPSALSRFLLWGDKKTLSDNIKLFLKKFGDI